MGLLKASVLPVWFFAVASLFADFPAAAFGRVLFWILVVAHAGECLLFLPILKQGRGGLGSHLLQTFVFGVFHVHGVRAELAAKSPAGGESA